MKIRVVIGVLLSLFTLNVNAQVKKGIEYSGFFDTYYWRGPISFTGGLGIAAYSGDLCSDFTCTKLKPHYSLGVAYKLWPRVFVGGELSIFRLAANDKSDVRNLDFTSKNTELAAYVDFYLREDIVKRHSDLILSHKLVKPYVSFGVSAMRFNVDVAANEVSFPKYSMFVPVGGGIFFDVTHRIGVKTEAIYHLGFTDYLDGVSKLASVEGKDGYGTIRVKVVYTPQAKRMKPKKIKIDEEERKKWSEYYSADSTKPASKPKVEPDPEESDPYYNDAPKDEESDTDENGDPKKEEDAGYDW
jgi:hypothetical protein